jgi:hypothetical protein
MAPDPWSAFLDWLTTVLIPSWGELIGLLPYVLVGTLVGPILTLILLMWVWHYMTRRRGRIRRGEPQPVAAPLGGDGQPTFPANVPYCETHALLFPARDTVCSVDGSALKVACPVDGTVRDAQIDTCTACGTRFTLGAARGTAIVLAQDGPPEGGAAVA